MDAFQRRSQFNIVDYETLWKIDLILRQHTPFDASRFARRELTEIAGVRLFTASAEDILITKLWWAKLGESEAADRRRCRNHSGAGRKTRHRLRRAMGRGSGAG